MTKYTRVIRDFSGGLSEAANDNMADNELVEAKNAIPGETYGISRAEGTTIAYPRITYTPAGSQTAVTAGAVLQLLERPIANSTAAEICAFCVNASDSAKVDMFTYSNNAWGLAAINIKKPLATFVYANKLFWLDGSDYKFYDGVAVASVQEDGTSNIFSKVQSAIAVSQRGFRWFFATTSNEVIVSEVGYYNKFTSSNVFNITSDRSDTITALHEFNDGMLIFRKRSIYYLTGWDFANATDINLAPLNVSTGTRWANSIKTVENAVLYMGDNGLYRLYIPTYSSVIASKNLTEKKFTVTLGDMNITDCFAELWNGVYHYTLVTPTERREYRYYVSTGALWGEYTQPVYCYAPGFLGNSYLYIGGSHGIILKYDRSSTHYIDCASGGTVAIPMRVKTKGFDVCGKMVQQAKLKKVFVAVKQFVQQTSNVKVQIKADYLDRAFNFEMKFDESLVYGEGEWGSGYWGWKDVVEEQITVSRKVHRLQFTLYDSTKDTPIVLYGVAMLYKQGKVKGNRDGVTKDVVIYD